MDSILTSIKKLLGITEEYTHFDQDVIIHVNTVFSNLHQMGVGPSDGFIITDKTKLWSDYGIFEESIRTYVYLKVKLLFDPPANSIMVESIKENIKELEWRLYSAHNFDIDNVNKDGQVVFEDL